MTEQVFSNMKRKRRARKKAHFFWKGGHYGNNSSLEQHPQHNLLLIRFFLLKSTARAIYKSPWSLAFCFMGFLACSSRSRCTAMT
jgi:hypothetical protein